MTNEPTPAQHRYRNLRTDLFVPISEHCEAGHSSKLADTLTAMIKPELEAVYTALLEARAEVAKLRKIAPEFGDLGPIRWPCGRSNIHVPHDWFPERPVQCAGLDDPDDPATATVVPPDYFDQLVADDDPAEPNERTRLAAARLGDVAQRAEPDDA